MAVYPSQLVKQDTCSMAVAAACLLLAGEPPETMDSRRPWICSCL